MTRQELISYIFDEYSVEPDFPFRMDDVTCVFRHIDNRKWFGIAMVIPYRTIGINKAGNVDILNVKCDPIMMGSLRGSRSQLSYRRSRHIRRPPRKRTRLTGSNSRPVCLPE